MDLKIILLIVATIVACGILNRVRGGGFGGHLLPSRALIWVAPAIAALTLLFSNYVVAIIMGATFGFWGAFSWGYTLGALAGYTPNRPMQPLEKFFSKFSPATGAFLRMAFVFPGVALIAWWTGHYLYLAAAPAFAALSVIAYRYLINPLADDSWQNAEIATGLIWGGVLIAPLILFTTPFFSF